jgi:ATP-binding cassette subfamily F protein 3
LFVSHDRYLIQALATQIWEVQDGRCQIYQGTYQRYLERRAEEAQAQRRGAQAERKAQPTRQPRALRSRAGERLEAGGVRVQQRKELEAREAELSQALIELEERVAQLEHALQEASYAGDPERIRLLTREYQERRAALEALYQEWNAVVDELQKLPA